MEKTVITVVGKDGVGIIAKVCNYLASNMLTSQTSPKRSQAASLT